MDLPRFPQRCGRSSGVEHLLAKQDVVGSNPIARSNPHFRRGYHPILNAVAYG